MLKLLTIAGFISSVCWFFPSSFIFHASLKSKPSITVTICPLIAITSYPKCYHVKADLQIKVIFVEDKYLVSISYGIICIKLSAFTINVIF